MDKIKSKSNYESICERCDNLNYSKNGVFACSKCGYVYIRRGI